MGMTLWIHTLEDRQMTGESDDHSLMYELAEELDVLCSGCGTKPLSSFFDTTDFDFNMSEEFDDEDADEEPAIDPETGLAYGIDDMKWFDAADGLATLQAVRAQVAGGWKSDMVADERAALIDELEDCIARLTDLPAGARFHLAVVM